MREPTPPPQGESPSIVEEFVKVHPDGSKEIVRSRRELKRKPSRWKKLKLGGSK